MSLIDANAPLPGAPADVWPPAGLPHPGPSDPIAARRLAWAEESLRAGDTAAAAELLEQTLDIAPESALVWFRLGEARAACGNVDAAVEAYRQAARRDPAGLLGTELKIASLGAAAAPKAAPPAYVKGLFDEYAAKFERHLTQALGYRGPQFLREALDRLYPARRFEKAIDLGCGTGLMARALADICTDIAGIDIAPKMISIARGSGLYTRAEVADALAFLETEPSASADLAAAADVFVYIGDLDPIFAQTAHVLRPGGAFLFSVQSADESDGAGYCVGEDLRFAHTPHYLKSLARAYGFEIKALDPAVLRKDRGRDVLALIAILERS
ncbi:MAG: methyltransferase domain-containing protein [Beijerinckiaceae bacterium]